MNDNKTQEFRGFDEVTVHASALLCLKYSSAIERVKWSLDTFTNDCSLRPSSRMDLSLTKCYEDTSSTNTSFRGVVTDNDSGYISQNVESNSSSIETVGDSRQMVMATSDLKYVNEDALLEKPQIYSNHNQAEENKDYEEFGHLFYMSDISGTPVLNSSVTSQKTNFSGFEGDESGVSEVSDVSATIPVATPLAVSSNVLNIEFNSEEDVNSITNENYLQQNAKVHEAIIPNNYQYTNDSEVNNPNFANSNKNITNLEVINNARESLSDKSLNSTFECETDISCVQARMMDANNCNMSHFESFYTFVCDLYTKNNQPTDDLINVSINPNNLQINRQNNKGNSPVISPYKNCYLQLETIKKSNGNDTVTFNLPVVNSEKIKDQPVMSDTLSKPQISQQKHQNKFQTNIKKRITPVKQQVKSPKPPISPELFSDEEPEPTEMLSRSMTQIKKLCDQMYITKNDRKLLKRTQESLGGVPPPPSITIIQMNAAEMLQKIEDNKHLFAKGSSENLINISNVNNVDNCVNFKEHVKIDKTCNVMNESKLNLKDSQSKPAEKRESLLVICKKEDIDVQWPDIMQRRFHGLHYNRSKISEEFEHLCVKYAERYIGAETQSSCTTFGISIESPTKRKFKLRRPTKSPGKRLSHLARRRITFSKDSLHAGPSSSSCIGSRTRQIMVDARKFELLSRRRSPRKRSPRKTPAKSPRRKSQTPSSSSKKRFATRLRRYNTTEDSIDSVASSSSSRASVTKRALFQSPPDKGETSNGLLQLFGANTSDSNLSESSRRPTPRRALFTSPFKASPSKMSISSLYPAKRRTTPKRALFKSPAKASPSSHTEVCDKKRKRTESEDMQPNKLARSMSLDARNSSNESKSKSVMRSHSSTSSLQTQDIAEHRKKKLMWAVAEALRSQNVDMKHPQFKVFASVLARIIRYFLPNLFTNGPRPEGSTTESMLRIARQHVFAVTRGKTVDEIIREVRNKSKVIKPSGYVSVDKVDRSSDILQVRNKENVLQDRVNTIGSNRSVTDANETNKNRRGESVERIRRVINFGDDDDNTGIR